MGDKPFILVDGENISLGQAFQYLRAARRLDEFITTILRQHVIERELKARPEIAIAPDTLEQAITTFRQKNHLMDPEDFQDWLEDTGMTEAALRQQALTDLQINQLKAKIAEPRLQEYFIERKLTLDQVVLSRIAVDQREVAEELREQLREGASFEELARDYSQTSDRDFNGMMGAVNRGDLPDVLRAALDTAAPGQVVGPLGIENTWMLFRVEKLQSAALDDPQILKTLQNEIFEEWVIDRLQGMAIEVKV